MLGKHTKKTDTEKTHKPQVDDMVTLLYDELMRNVSMDELLRTKSVGNRGRQIGLLSTLLCNAVERSCIYYMDGNGHIFDGKTYQPYRTEDLNVCIRKMLESDKWNFDESMRRNGTIQDLSASIKAVVRTRRLTLDHELIAFKNGILNLNTLEFLEHNRALAPFCYLDFDYDPSAECPRWDSFLEEVLPIQEKRDLLQEFLGAPFIDRKKVKLEHMMILYGAGSNGKSVIAHTITELFGSNNVTHFSLDDLLSSSDQAKNTDKLNNKLLNYSEEIAAVNSARFGDRLKALISGDSVMCRPIYGESYAADNLPLLIANANKLPHMDDASHGLLRRLIILEFDRIIPTNQQDHMLETKLAREKSGILNWLLEGRARLLANDGKFSSLGVIEATAQEFMCQNNSALEYMFSLGYQPTPATPEDAIAPAQLPLTQLYSDYDQWCVKQRYRPKNNNEFRTSLESAGYCKHRKAKGMVFDIYGSKIADAIKMEAKPLQDAKSSDRKKPIALPDGRIVVKGDFAAASAAHLSRPWITTMRIAGKLNKAIINASELGLKENPFDRYFDVQALIQVAKQYRAYLRDEELEKFDREIATNQDICRKFNFEMREQKRPFRKLCIGLTNGQQYMMNGDDYIIVDVDWEFNEAEAKELLEDYEAKKVAKIR